ncbi:MAG: ABC transporter permease [Treponema sp.]
MRIANLTKQQLQEIGIKQKTKFQKIVDICIVFLPVIILLFSLFEYYYIPNFGDKKSTNVYGFFLSVQLCIFLFLGVLSLFIKLVFYKTRNIAPFASLVYILLIIYDYAALKTNAMLLPYFPWLDNIFNAMIEDRVYLLDCIKNSLILLFTGYFYGVVIGLITGIACGYSKFVNYWISPFMKLLGAVPSLTWIPVIMVFAQTLFQGAVIVLAFGVWYSVTMASYVGIKNIDKSYYEAAKTLGANEYQLVLKVAIPSALPHIFQGLVLGMSSACLALLAAEMMGVESGLGWYIAWQKGWAKFSNMYAAIIIICIIFVIVNYTLNYAKRKVLKWQEGVIQ